MSPEGGKMCGWCGKLHEPAECESSEYPFNLHAFMQDDPVVKSDFTAELATRVFEQLSQNRRARDASIYCSDNQSSPIEISEDKLYRMLLVRFAFEAACPCYIETPAGQEEKTP